MKQISSRPVVGSKIWWCAEEVLHFTCKDLIEDGAFTLRHIFTFFFFSQRSLMLDFFVRTSKITSNCSLQLVHWRAVQSRMSVKVAWREWKSLEKSDLISRPSLDFSCLSIAAPGPLRGVDIRHIHLQWITALPSRQTLFKGVFGNLVCCNRK